MGTLLAAVPANCQKPAISRRVDVFAFRYAYKNSKQCDCALIPVISVLISTMDASLQESDGQIAEKCKAANLTCGHVINKCGTKITCGKCKWPKQCHDGKCFCIPVSHRLH